MLPPFPLEFLALPDDQLALAFHVWRAAASLESMEIEVDGVPLGQVQADELPPALLAAIYLTAEEQARECQLGQDTDNESLAGIEKALRLTLPDSDGNVPLENLRRAGSLIRQFVARESVTAAALDEAISRRRHQSDIASRKRSRGHLYNELTKMVQARHTITAAEAIDGLERLADQQAHLDPRVFPRIERVDRTEDNGKGIVEWSEPKQPEPLSKSAPLSGIPKMLSRIRGELGIPDRRKSKSR